MAEYISREAFAAEMKSRQDAAEKWLIEATGTEDAYGKARAEAILSFLCEVKLTLDAIPAADVREVVRGHWRKAKTFDIDSAYECSVCGDTPFYDEIGKFNYCRSCGADMREVEHGS